MHLDLSNNSSSGKIQEFKFNNTLVLVSVKQNQLQGPIPKSLLDQQDLQVLILSQNNFSGQIASTVCNLKTLFLLDLGSNHLNGTIPQCLGEMSGLQNRFEGYLPSITGDLVGLRTLNLSHNGLEGIIPASLQHLSVLESLDLSSNKIGAEIPQQLVSLTSLAVLNLSHNHLVGCIPKEKQFDMFENSSYQGNDGLRGLPLSKDCGGNYGVPQATTPAELDEEEEGDLISWQAVLLGYGCGLVIGLSIIYIML
ncbi:hypothetical protein CQW23_27993 [Capsicum baccatum]|uniref:Receptor-like protein 12 n=1 Tax=Capsicum baccatum TaxID=33114 RepID=A0A2G2VFB0_CAPBA|nr:hypothetical protein CQW23_27993 [Capsicum baccatum]